MKYDIIEVKIAKINIKNFESKFRNKTFICPKSRFNYSVKSDNYAICNHFYFEVYLLIDFHYTNYETTIVVNYHNNTRWDKSKILTFNNIQKTLNNVLKRLQQEYKFTNNIKKELDAIPIHNNVQGWIYDNQQLIKMIYGL